MPAVSAIFSIRHSGESAGSVIASKTLHALLGEDRRVLAQLIDVSAKQNAATTKIASTLFTSRLLNQFDERSRQARDADGVFVVACLAHVGL